MDEPVSQVMDARLAELLALWRRVGKPLAGSADVLAVFASHAGHLLVIDHEDGHSRYAHYGPAFVERFGADLTGCVIDALPSDILPADRRGMMAFEYAFVRQVQRPLWRSYTARFDNGRTETWQRLVLPVGGTLLAVGAYPCETGAERPDTATSAGLLRFMIERVPVVLDDDGRVEDLALSLRAFSDAQQHAAELEVLASLDPLTGVSNLRHFHHMAGLELDHARRMGRTFALLALDIDHFKRINDTWGHAAGDQALIAFVAACRQALREPDILGRCGGEEFAVALPNTNLDGAKLIAERLRIHVENLQVELPDGHLLAFTVSVGVVSCGPGDEGFAATSIQELLKRADAALYRSKREGRNRISVADSAGEPDEQGEQGHRDGLRRHAQVQ